MMKPYSGAIEVWEVWKDVGNVRNNKPWLLDQVALVQQIAAARGLNMTRK